MFVRHSSIVPLGGLCEQVALSFRADFSLNYKEFAEEVKKQYVQMDSNKLDKIFLESDEFAFLIRKILIANAQTYEREKIAMYARILINSATLEKSGMKYKESFVNIVDDLSTEHIKILSIAYNKVRDEVGKKNIHIVANESANLLGLDNSQIVAYCEQMARYGLVMDSQKGIVLDYQPGYYEITNYGLQFIEFILKQP